MKEAMHWKKEEDGKVRCLLCPHQCSLGEGETGICSNKRNAGGTLEAARFGEITALAMDPIEKKPLYHFHPGEQILSVGTYGCNLSCDFCQNHHLWNGHVPAETLLPKDLVARARGRSFAIAYTYNEPFMGYEYVLESARLAHAEGIKNVLVTNGYYNPGPFEELLPYIDAMNIDLKSMRDDFYKRLCGARLKPVQRTIERAVGGCLVELTNLIIPGENDSDRELAELAGYVAGVSPDIPMHFSAYRPMHKRRNPPTPSGRLEKAYELARARLKYVYVGNVIMGLGSDSECPSCGATLVKRSGYRTRVVGLAGDKCGACGESVNFVA